MSVSTQVSFSEPVSTVRQDDPSQQAATANPLPIAPKPGPLELSIVTLESTSNSSLPSASSPRTDRRAYAGSTAQEYPTPSSTVAPKFQPDIDIDRVDRSHIPEPRGNRTPPHHTTHYDFDALHYLQDTPGQPPMTPARTSPLDWSSGPNSASLLSTQELFHDPNGRYPASASFFQSYPATPAWLPPTSASTSSGPSFYEASLKSSAYISHQSEHVPGFTEKQREYHDGYQLPDQGLYMPAYMPHTGDWSAEDEGAIVGRQFQQVEDADGDPYDVSDEELEELAYEDKSWQGQLEERHLNNNDVGVVVALQARQETHELGVRSFTSFIDRPNMLSTYTPSPQSSPLNESMTARLFCHFIYVIGPSMSMFERHPANPSLIFQGQPVPKSQQHIWTCKLQFVLHEKISAKLR